MPEQPVALTVRTYQVGFGDCFLLSFRYDSIADRHVLIDFGSMKKPPGRPKLMDEVAASIAEECGGKLHMVVATHRHQDHIKGFGLKKAGAIIKKLKPDLVMQPWTEDPDIAVDADAPLGSAQEMRMRLANMNQFAAGFFAETDLEDDDRTREAKSPVAHLRSADSSDFSRLSFMGENNISNLAAIKNLQAMAKGVGIYAHAKIDISERIADVLPGISLDVLGPPTVEQHAGVTKQRSKHPDQFWNMQAAAGEAFADGVSDPFPQHTDGRGGVGTLWFRYRVKRAYLNSLKSVVRDLDNALNNTSLILLFRVAGKSFLFPGDAQWENWQFALQDEDVLAKLADVDVYKVSHHASKNATPLSLWDVFKKRGDAHKQDRMTALLSTLAGKHGHAENNSEVPRDTLVEALEKDTTLINTQDFPDRLFVATEFELTADN